MHPVLFELPWGTTANAYGTLILLGGALTLPGIYWDAKRRGVGDGRPGSFVVDFYLVLIFGAFVGGRVLHVLTAPSAYIDDPMRLLSTSDTGFVFFGSLLGLILGWVWLARRYDMGFGALCDVGATWMGLGHAFGRLGCLMAGCCWGAPTDGATGFAFPETSVVYVLRGAPIVGEHTTPLHPTPLYESLGLASIFVVLLAFRLRHGIERPWRQASRYALGYGCLRVTTEVFRGDLSRGFLTMWHNPDLASWLCVPPDHPLALSVSQAIALGLIALGAFGLRRTRA